MTRSARFTGTFSLLLPLLALAQETSTAVQPAEPVQPVVQAEPELPTVVQVTGIATLVDYATVGRLLGAVEGVRRVDVIEAEDATVTFRVLVRGGSAAVERA